MLNFKSLFLRSKSMPTGSQIFGTSLLTPRHKSFSSQKEVPEDCEQTELERYNRIKDFLKLSNISFSTEDLGKYNTDWTGNFRGDSKLTVFPKDTEQVQQVIQWCNSNSLNKFESTINSTNDKLHIRIIITILTTLYVLINFNNCRMHEGHFIRGRHFLGGRVDSSQPR